MLDSLLGIWMFTGLIFQGTPIDKPNPELVIYYNFYSESENSILYYRRGQNGFCERKAYYSVKQNQIIQKVYATDPDNIDSCDQDPDMQINRLSFTKFEIKDGQLLLHLPLGEDQLTYVWSRLF